jgi:hypothetical protein
MNDNARTLLVLLGIGAVFAFLVSPWSPLPGTTAPTAAEGLTDIVWRQGYPVGHEHLCKPYDIDGGPLMGPHPLYRRPARVGHHRTGLIDNGWSWVFESPTEVDVP